MNAALNGAFTDLARGFSRVMALTKMTVMLGFSLASFNLHRARSFRGKHHLDETGQPRTSQSQRGLNGVRVPGPKSSNRQRSRHLLPTKG